MEWDWEHEVQALQAELAEAQEVVADLRSALCEALVMQRLERDLL